MLRMCLSRLPLPCVFVLVGLMVVAAALPAQARPGIRLTESSVSYSLPRARAEFPHPDEPRQLFFVQRTPNANTVVYAARFTADGRLDPRRPVVAYWRRYASQGQTMRLRWYERLFGYGVWSRPNRDGSGYLVGVNAMRNTSVELRQTGPFQAALWTRVDNRDFQLVYGYLDLDESGMLPRVERLRLYTTDPETGRYVTHFFAVSGGEYHE
jgi:hypothetical protein